ncbi:translationally-controlled tumor protein homolog [Branchiostoma lanceolatum]|uniref:translationally-controlled tumor protein homolog n=1 Tax=Branchiostoma lanceolatum TaxID=7740 RepID=UPI00345379F5
MGSLRAALLVLFLCGITTHFSTGLTIYEDVISGDEMFSDFFKIFLREDGILYEVEGKVVTRQSAFEDPILEGADPVDITDSVVSGVNIVFHHNLQETELTKKQYKDYMKGYLKRVKERLEKENPDRVDIFMKDVEGVLKEILASFNDLQFFIGKSENKEGMVALLDWRQDGRTPYMLFFKDGLEKEKA